MAVMIASHKSSEPKRAEILTKRHKKPQSKTRPITATLEHPLILDIKLLKKLDMTTFTKKGLMALSKFCGISLINKTETKKKFNKCVRTVQYSKKQMETDFAEPCLSQRADSNKRELRAKRKLVKQISKAKPHIRFKMAKGDSSPDEDALDLVCKNHSQVLKTLSRITNCGTDNKLRGKTTISAMNGTVENIIPEPCKTCSRSEHPERFHSHPKMLTRLALQEKSNGKKEEEQLKEALSSKEHGGYKKEEGKKSPCATERADKSPQEFLVCEEKKLQNSSKCDTKSPVKCSSSSPETPNKNKSKSLRSPFTSSQSTAKSKDEAVKRTAKPASNQTVEKMSGEVHNIMKSKRETETKRRTWGCTEDGKRHKASIYVAAEEAMKFVTGCYVCGKQLSPKSRMKHEKSCIEEWRSQNVVFSGDERRAEPKRPDFRFTASGDLDCEGTFESIWANHVDSLVPCKKCGRTFFPDRIERHENCCNNLPVGVKYKH